MNMNKNTNITNMYKPVRWMLPNLFGRGVTESTETVDEAFEQLKPADVRNAEKIGIPVLRQGEYFFVLSSLSESDLASLRGNTQMFLMQKPFVLADKDQRNSHHVATEGFKVHGLTYVRGTVRHDRREHRMLKLGKRWYTVHENMQKASFNATGGFD